MTRWIRFFIVLIVGIGLGVLYGRVVNPVEYVNTTTESLRSDYKTDYVLMVAEVYQTDQDLRWAMNRLALLGCETPQACVETALDFAVQSGYAAPDLSLIEDLNFALGGNE
ncbi:MAG: hypothetical protein DRI56_09275 [Chloroflexota bacterium]|nr:MAG: hypothetical protein DRI56_09275 [Chloroflexota bacterium]